MNRVFSKNIRVLVVIILALSCAVKVHDIFFPKKISDWNYQQLNKISSISDDFSFSVFGDNKNSISTFNELLTKVSQDNSIFSINLGDLVFDGEKEKYRFFISQIENFKKPLLTVIGNHELREGGRGNYYNFFGKYYYSFAVNSSYFIVLDNANEENIDPWQMKWLEEELVKSKNHKQRFVFMHVPLFDPRKGEYRKGKSLKDLEFAKKLNVLLDTYNVTMLFTSHIHAYFNGKWGKTPYIITGGAGAELGGLDKDHYFYHYIKVIVNSNGVKYEVVRLKTPEYELFDRLRHDTWIYAYAFVSIHFLDILIFLSLLYVSTYIFRICNIPISWNKT